MTQETTSLDDALEPQAPETPETEAVEPQPEPEQPETGQKATVSDDGQIKVPLAALHEVRDANRALKREMEALKAAQQPKPEPEQVPDMFNDPEGYAAYQERRIDAAVNNVASQFNNRLLNMSEAAAVRTHGAEVVEKAKEWALSQPDAVRADIVTHADPFEYAVTKFNEQTVAQQLADPEVMAKFQAFMSGGQPKPEPKTPPTNTAVDQSVGARQVQWAGPTSLDDIFSN